MATVIPIGISAIDNYTEKYNTLVDTFFYFLSNQNDLTQEEKSNYVARIKEMKSELIDAINLTPLDIRQKDLSCSLIALMNRIDSTLEKTS